MGNGQNGKGDSSRPLSISKKEFDKRWDKIFGKKDKKDKKDKKKDLTLIKKFRII